MSYQTLRKNLAHFQQIYMSEIGPRFLFNLTAPNEMPQKVTI